MKDTYWLIICVLIYIIFIFGQKTKYIIIHKEWYIVILLNWYFINLTVPTQNVDMMSHSVADQSKIADICKPVTAC